MSHTPIVNNKKNSNTICHMEDNYIKYEINILKHEHTIMWASHQPHVWVEKEEALKKSEKHLRSVKACYVHFMWWAFISLHLMGLKL